MRLNGIFVRFCRSSRPEDTSAKATDSETSQHASRNVPDRAENNPCSVLREKGSLGRCLLRDLPNRDSWKSAKFRIFPVISRKTRNSARRPVRILLHRQPARWVSHLEAPPIRKVGSF